ncbi:hypothetical protein V8E54_004762 [Elaphomyces granulatus]
MAFHRLLILASLALETFKPPIFLLILHGTGDAAGGAADSPSSLQSLISELPTSAKRRAPRDAITKGAKMSRYKRPKTMHMSDANVTDEQFTQWYNELDRAMRWEVFLFHTNHIENVIDEITDGVLAHDTYRWGRVRTKANDTART